VNEHELRAKIKKYNKISTPFVIVGLGGFFTIPVCVVTENPLFIITIALGVIGLVVGVIFGSKTTKMQEELDNITGVTAEREETERKVREERFDKFLHGLDKNNAITDPRPPLTDKELMARINELAPKIKLYNALLKIFLVLSFVGFLPLNVLFPMLGFAPFVLVALFGFKAIKNESELKCIVGNSIVRNVLSDTFELTNYSPGCHLAYDAISEAKLIQSWNRTSGSDLIEGKYRGVRFSFSDLTLQHESGSGKNRSTTTRFKGQWLIIELAKNLPEAVQIKEREKSSAKSDVETENMEFNQKFQIKTESPHTAFFVLTPHFMEYILSAKKRANSKMHMSFSGTRAHIALHSGRDLFEPTSKKLYDIKNIEMLRNQMKWDAKYITGIIDELLLNENLFKGI